MSRGWALTKKAWGVVRSHPEIARLPVYGGLLALVSMGVFGVFPVSSFCHSTIRARPPRFSGSC